MRDQGGFALLLTLLVLVIGAAGVYVSLQDPVEADRASEARVQATALALARDAVIARAAADDNRPGSLSCPDIDGNGSAGKGSPPDCTARLGRFPHQTYATETLLDAAGERIWYGIAEGVLDQGKVTVNPNTVETFEVNGRPGNAAVVIAPGGIVEGQNRGSGNRNDPEQYLEVLEDEDVDNTEEPYRDCGNLDACNDRVRGITTAELFEIPQRRLLAVVSGMLKDFFDRHGHLPYAAPFGDTECDGTAERLLGSLPFKDDKPETGGDCGGDVLQPPSGLDKAWIEDNSWYDFVVYRVDSDCAGAGASCSTRSLTLGNDESFQVVIAVAGRTLESPAHDPSYRQDRPVQDIKNYLDSEENTDGDSEFDDMPPRIDDNDSLRGVVVN